MGRTTSLLEILGFAAVAYTVVVIRELIATGGKPRLRMGYWLAGFLCDPTLSGFTKAYLVLANWAILVVLIEVFFYFGRKF